MLVRACLSTRKVLGNISAGKGVMGRGSGKILGSLYAEKGVKIGSERVGACVPRR